MTRKEFDKLHGQPYLLNEIDKAVIAYSEDVYNAQISYDSKTQIIWIRVENTEFRVHCSCPNYLAVYHRNSYSDVSKWHKQFERINFKGKVYKAIAMCVLHEWRCENWSYNENIRRYIKDSRKYYQQLNAINWANSCINYGEDCIIRHE